MAVKRKTKKVAAIPAPNVDNSELTFASSAQDPEYERKHSRLGLIRTGFGGGAGSGVLSDTGQAAYEKGADPHADGAPIEGPTTANAIECEDTD